MKAAIETREIITVSSDGFRLRGTYHRLRHEESGSLLDSDERNRIGVLFPSQVLPRAGGGDSAVYWADSLAKIGYRSFRFDLPGIGDSDGDLSKDVDLQSSLDVKGCARLVSVIANDLVERFNLRGVVVCGHCDGAVTALYSAAANARIKGLMLLDPYFNVKQDSEIKSVAVRWQSGIVGKLVSDRPTHANLRKAARKMLSLIRNIYHRFQAVHRLVRGKRLPGNANLPLIRCWKQLASTGVPMLVLRSPSATPKPGDFDYIRDLQPPSDGDSRICVKPIEGATHSFAEHRSKEAVLKHAEQWLSNCFPLTRPLETRDTKHYAPELADAV